MEEGDGSLRCCHVLWGHAGAVVTSACVDTRLDVCVSGDSKGNLVVHTARGGKFVRRFALHGDNDNDNFNGKQRKTQQQPQPQQHEQQNEAPSVDGGAEDQGGFAAERSSSASLSSSAPSPAISFPSQRRLRKRCAVNVVALDSVHGNLVAHSWGSKALGLFSANGTRKAFVEHCEQALSCVVFSKGSHCLITGGSGGYVTFRRLPSLAVVRSMHLGCPVLAISLAPEGGHEVLCSTADGALHVLSDPSFTLTERMPDMFAETFVGGSGGGASSSGGGVASNNQRQVDFSAAAAFL